ncbi:hypothetical protein [Sanguibacter sp. 25GB23B1]|uniref:hypothetical protein n=1 Tax=unclassified Sanguibacter TaxID=2645534 RepID=UPI0032AF38D5
MRTPTDSARAPGASRARTPLAGIVGIVALVVLLTGCAGPDPLTPLDPGSAPQEDADEQAQRLERVLEDLELRYAVSDPSTPAQILGPYVPAEQAAAEITEHVALGSQSRAYVSAHAAYLDDEWGGAERPTAVDVVAEEARVVGTVSEDPVARVVMTTTYAFDDAPATVVSAEYAISWSSATGPDEVRLDEVYPLYDDAGRPALDSGEGKGSPSGAVHDYLRAVTHGSSRDVDSMEGTIHTSEDLREALKAQLVASPRYTPVEIPPARAGDQHVVYFVPDSGARAVRLEVTVTDDGPMVVPRL